MEIEKLEKLRKAWYNDKNVLFNVIDAIKYRETVFLEKGRLPIRCVKANALGYLFKNFDRFGFFRSHHNLYNSLGHYPDLPMFSYNPVVKRREMDDFNRNFLSYMTKYDFLLDIDNEDIGHALDTLIKVKQIFTKYKVPAWYMFSGKKGFHVRVDYDMLPAELKSYPLNKLAILYKKFTETFKYVNGFDDIDETVYDLRRITKTPYSVVYPYYMVAMPLSDHDINNFDIKNMTLVHNINRTSNLCRRRTLVREGESAGFMNLIRYYVVFSGQPDT